MPTLIQPSFGRGVLSPQLYARVDTAMYQVALRTAHNAIIHNYGGVSNRPGTVFIGPVKDHSEANIRLIDFQFNTEDQYVLEFGNQYMRVIRNDGHVVETAVNITGATAADPVVVTAAAHGYSNGDEVFITGIVGMTELNGKRYVVANVTANTFELTNQYTGVSVDGTGFTAYASGGTAARVFTLTTPYQSADLPELKYVQSADTVTLTHPGYAARDLTRTGHASWTLTAISFAPVQAAPTSVIVTPNTSGSTTYNYQVTALADETFEESLAATGSTSTGAATPNNTVSWTGAAGAIRYSVYRSVNGVFGFIGEADGTSFVDNNIGPDLTLSPPISKNPFSGAGNFPGTSSYYQQRQHYGGSTNEPDTVRASKTGVRKNFNISIPLQDDDAITATLNAAQVNEIRHLVPTNDLLIFTSGSEWLANSGGDSAYAPTTIKFKPQSSWGCSHIRPIKVGDEVLFIEPSNAKVRSLGYSFNVDGYTGTDLGILAQHLLAEDGPDKYLVRDWAFQNFPEPRMHMVRTDGWVLTMTYDQEQEVIAWTTWDTDGKFEACTSLKRSVSDVEDGVYFVVKRVINGTTVRFIERLHTRKFADVRDGFFVDAGSTFDNPQGISSISTSGDLVITTTGAHGFQVDDIVEFDGIEWEPLVTDEFGNETPPDFLNDRRYRVIEVTSNTFKLSKTEVV